MFLLYIVNNRNSYLFLSAKNGLKIFPIDAEKLFDEGACRHRVCLNIFHRESFFRATLFNWKEWPVASNFHIFRYQTKNSLHLKLYGDFDGSSAHELVNALELYGPEKFHIFVDTNDLSTIHDFGREVLIKNLSMLDKLKFIGGNKHKISPPYEYWGWFYENHVNNCWLWNNFPIFRDSFEISILTRMINVAHAGQTHDPAAVRMNGAAGSIKTSWNNSMRSGCKKAE